MILFVYLNQISLTILCSQLLIPKEKWSDLVLSITFNSILLIRYLKDSSKESLIEVRFLLLLIQTNTKSDSKELWNATLLEWLFKKKNQCKRHTTSKNFLSCKCNKWFLKNQIQRMKINWMRQLIRVTWMIL